MNGLNKITERIAFETQEEIASLQAESQDKCREIKASYEKLAQDEYRRIVRDGADDAQLQAQRLSRAAALEAKKSILAMKQKAVSEVLDKALERICSLPGDEYVSFLSRLAADASVSGEESIILNARDKAEYSKAVLRGANDILKKRGKSATLSVSDTVGDFKGGLLVQQGDIVVNCTVETLVAMSRDRLSSQIAEILFEE